MQTNDFSNLPTSWQIKTLGEICEILDNMRKPINSIEREQRLKNSTTKYAYYGATGQVGYIDDFLCDFESILLGEDGAPFLEPFKDKAYIVSGKYWVNNHAHILKAKENFAINKFVCYFLNIVDYMPYVSGTTRLKLNQSAMKQIKIPLPPLEIQKRIVARLESAFEKIEKGSAHLQDAKTKLAKYKQSLLKSAFDGTLTAAASLQGVEKAETIHKVDCHKSANANFHNDDKSVDCHDLTSSNLAMTDKENPKLPQGWTIKTLGEIGEIVTGSTPNTKNREYYGDEYPFYKPTDLNLGYCVENSSDMVSSKGFEISRKLPSKSILVTCIGATIGKTGLIRNAGICNQQINAIIPKQNICPEFVYFYCISNAMQELIKTNASATTLPILNKTAFSKLPIPLPPLETQKQIVKLLEKHLQHADKTGEFIESALNKAKQLKQSLLKSAFLGKLT